MQDFSAFSLKGKLVLISGGATGLGLGMAKAVVRAGGCVVITGRREDKLKEACKQLDGHGSYYVNDITNLSEIPSLIKKIEQEQGSLHTVISNAGIHLKKYAEQTADDEFQRVIDTHVCGGFALAREAAHYMLERGEGCILFITSMAAVFALPQTIAYTAAKSALGGMVRTLAAELSPAGIRVNAIAPGWIESPMQRQSFEGDPKRRDKILSRMPMGKLGTAEDIGNAAVFLASPAASYITGTELRVDGGVSIGF